MRKQKRTENSLNLSEMFGSIKKKSLYTTLGISLFVMTGCLNPYDKKVPEDPQDSEKISAFMDDLDKVKPDDKRLLSDFIDRMAEAKKKDGYGFIQATTVRQAIEKQQQFTKDEAERAEQERIAEEEKRVALEQKQMELASVCSVTVTKMNFKEGKIDKENPDNSTPGTLTMELSFENKSAKDVIGLSGKMEFRDHQGNLIREFKVPLEEEIKAGATKTWAGDLPYDASNEQDARLAAVPIEELSTTWVPEGFAFGDGSFLKLGL